MTTYFIDQIAGNDSNLGYSPCCPWKTIAKINGFSFNPNDEILFKSGNIWNEQLTIPNNQLCFGKYWDGPKPIIDGTGNQNCILTNGKHEIQILELHLRKALVDNLYVQYGGNQLAILRNLIELAEQHGIMMIDGPNNCEVGYNEIKSCNIGIHLDGNKVNVGDGCDNNMIHFNSIYGNSSGVGFEDGANNNQVYMNKIWNNSENGIYVDQDNNSPMGNKFKWNEIFSGKQGILLYQKGDNAEIEFNHIHDNSGFGISLDGAGEGNKIKYNIILDNATESWAQNAAVYITGCSALVDENITGEQVVVIE